MKKLFLYVALLAWGLQASTAAAQHKIGYVDSEYILQQTPEFATVQQNLDRMAQEWEREITQKQGEVEGLFREYQARELLYTQEERQQRREAIVQTESEVEQLRMQYFGPDGELFRQQEQLLRPIQERILIAIEEVAKDEDYDYVLDKSGDVVFLYAPEDDDLSDKVLEELGIELEPGNARSGR